MRKLVISIIFLTSVSLLSQTQFTKGSEYCSFKKINSPHSFILNGDSPNSPKHTFDVLDYKIYLDIRNCFLSPYPRNYNAYVIVKFRVDTALSAINLNAVNTSLTINSVSMSGVSFTHTNNILTVTLNRVYNPSEIVYVRIDYTHNNVSDGAFYVSNGMVFTDCEPEGARKWFPCWDKPSDKATVDITVKVPLSVKLGSNGRLNDSLVTGDTIYYHWISRDPVPTYLVVLSGKVNYNLDIVYWHKISNPADSVPIRFYYNAGENPTGIKNIIGTMTTHFSQKFGEHPFEKNGFATLNNQFTWGGMENQTLTSLCPGCWSQNLVSHEYAHQWFGDMITCCTWADIWLNEGFATFIEAIWYEYTSGYAAYKSDILSSANSYLSGNPGRPIYVPEWAINTPPNNLLFNYAMTYAKGACVLHMLRYTLGDSLFFTAIKAYATDTTDFKYKSAATVDFSDKISQAAGQDLWWFIDEWVMKPNHPVYANIYQFINQGSSWAVGFQATQTQTNTPFHKMPIVLRITFSTGPDTNIRVMNDTNNQVWFWTFSRQPTNLQFDPNNDIVLKQGTTGPGVINGIISSNEVPFVFALHQNYPNPFNPGTTIKFDVPRNSKVLLRIYNTIGELVSEPVNKVLAAGKYSLGFDASGLPSGVYFYEIKAGDFSDTKRMVLIK